MKAKYAFVSVLSTATDFSVFALLSWLTDLFTAGATLLGMAFGAAVSWTLHRFWVFAHSERSEGQKRRLYFLGLLLSVLLNLGLMWLLVDCLFFPKAVCRVLVATAVWGVIFWYNRRVVFGV